MRPQFSGRLLRPRPGLTVAEDDELGIVFVSAQPERAHHEFVLA
jgi:hypothetical protein